ncbi:MAG: ribonuclease HII [bacterium]
MIIPNQNYENQLYTQGYQYIAGIDEAGRGAWAGPLVSAAVIMPRDKIIKDIRDSKTLTPQKREELCEDIKKISLSWSVAIININFINQYNIGKANIKAFKMAINKLKIKPDYLLIDGILKLKNHPIQQQSIKNGDALVYSIAAASIIAKVARDNILKKEHLRFPEYGFDEHKGYGTKKHQEALGKYGICEIHRTLYKPIIKIIGK